MLLPSILVFCVFWFFLLAVVIASFIAVVRLRRKNSFGSKVEAVMLVCFVALFLSAFIGFYKGGIPVYVITDENNCKKLTLFGERPFALNNGDSLVLSVNDSMLAYFNIQNPHLLVNNSSHTLGVEPVFYRSKKKTFADQLFDLSDNPLDKLMALTYLFGYDLSVERMLVILPYSMKPTPYIAYAFKLPPKSIKAKAFSESKKYLWLHREPGMTPTKFNAPDSSYSINIPTAFKQIPFTSTPDVTTEVFIDHDTTTVIKILQMQKAPNRDVAYYANVFTSSVIAIDSTARFKQTDVDMRHPITAINGHPALCYMRNASNGISTASYTFIETDKTLFSIIILSCKYRMVDLIEEIARSFKGR